MLQTDQRTASPGLAGFMRLLWMLLGPATTAIGCAGALQASSLGAYDIVTLVGLVVMVSARWLDVIRFGGLTAEGEPATITHCIRYSAVAIGLTGAVWAFATWLRS